MDDIFLLLFLLSPLALIIGLIKPGIFTRIFRRKLSRKKLSALFGGATILFFILFGVTTDYTPKEQIAQPDIEKTDKGAALGETAEEFQTEESASDTKETATESIKVTKVIDGDTIEIEGGQRVRYIGIDTPESDECFANVATSKNKELVLGKEIRMEKDVSETDGYGRLLRYAWVGDIFVNDYLVRQGYAQASTYPPDVKYQDQFLEAQREARKNTRGLWEACSEEQEIKPTSKTVASPTPSTLTPITEVYTCDCSKTCSQMSSCDEAYYQLNTCGCSIRDGDKDGVPCENICPGG